MATNQNFIVKNGIVIEGTTNSSDTSSGALIVAGGAGIAGDLYVGGTIYMKNQGLDSISSTTGTFLNVLVTGTNVASTVTSGALQVAGGVGIQGSLYAGNIYDNGNRVLTSANLGNFGVTSLAAGTDTAISTSTGAVTVWNTSTLQTITSRGATTNNALTLTNATSSSNTTTGALIVTGGVGIGGDLNVGGTLNVAGGLSGTITTATNIAGGIATEIPFQTATGITGFSTNFEYNDTYKKLTVGNINVWGNTSAGFGLSNAANVSIDAASGNSVQLFSNNLAQLNYNGANFVTVDTNGAKLVTTGATLTLDSTGNLTLNGSGTLTAPHVQPNNLTSGRITYYNGSYLVDNSALTFDGTTVTVPKLTATGTSTFQQNVIIQGTDNATTSTNGALTVAGGVGIVKDLVVGGKTTVYGPTTFADTVTFNGTATYVLSTNTVYTDNIIEVHVPPAGVNAQWTYNDGKDIGLRFHYFNKTLSTDSNAALVLANDTQWLEWYGTGAESNTGTFVGASYGGFKTGQAYLTNTTNATTSTNSGAALQVDGGTGIAKDLWVGGAAYVGGNLVITSANIGNYGVSKILTSSGISVDTSTGIVTISNTGVLSLTAGTDTSVSASVGTITVWNTSTLQTVTNRGATTNNAITVTNATASTGTTTGALIVSGGVGIGGSLYAGRMYSNGSEVLTTSSLATAGVSSITAGTDTAVSTSTGAITVWNTSTLQSITNRGATTNNAVNITNSSLSANTNSGQALLVTGGIGAQAVYATNLFDSGNRVVTSVTANAGTGIAITGATTGGPSASFTIQNFGVTSLAASGSGIAVSASTGSVSITNLGVTSLTGTANQISVSASTGSVTLSLPSTIAITTGSFTNVTISGTQIATSTNTGALQVVGGVGIGSSIYVGSTATVAGSLIRTGNLSGANWANTSVGFGFSVNTATYTETLAVGNYGSGIVSISSFGVPTLTDTSGAITLGDAATVFIAGAPVAGSNVTFNGNAYSLLVGSGNVKISSATAAASPISAALVVGGGLGLGGGIISNGSAQFNTGGLLIGSGGGVSTASWYTTYTLNVGSGTGAQNIDTYSTSTYRTARYLVQVVDGAKVHVSEITLFHDGGTVYKNEYGISTNTGELGEFDASLVGGTITLTFTPSYTPAAMVITGNRTLITK